MKYFSIKSILILMIDYIFYNLCSYFFFLKLSCGGWRQNHQKSTLNGSRFHFLLFPLLLFTQLLDVSSIWENIYLVTSKRSNYIFATILKLKILIVLRYYIHLQYTNFDFSYHYLICNWFWNLKSFQSYVMWLWCSTLSFKFLLVIWGVD